MGVHDGHRKRLKERFLEHGLDNFNELNALELLLFYAVPRRDTNELAHALLERFENLQGLFEASYEELCELPGVGEAVAGLIMLVPQLYKKSFVTVGNKIETICNSSDAGKYLIPKFMLHREEIMLLVCLDSQKRVIACVELARGVVNSVNTSVRLVVETALKKRACSVILAHNHPDGFAIPSREDELVTQQLASSLSLVGVKLDDHIIVAGEDFVSFADSGMFLSYR